MRNFRLCERASRSEDQSRRRQSANRRGLSRHLPFPDSCRGQSGTQSDPGPILKHRSGPSSQLSGPIAGFLPCVEDAQRLRPPSAPSPRQGPTGLHRTQFRNPNRKSRKKEKAEKIGSQMLSFARHEIGTAKAIHNF